MDFLENIKFEWKSKKSEKNFMLFALKFISILWTAANCFITDMFLQRVLGMLSSAEVCCKTITRKHTCDNKLAQTIELSQHVMSCLMNT